MSDPVEFIDAEKVLTRLESIETRLERLEGAMEAIAAALGIEYEPSKKESEEA